MYIPVLFIVLNKHGKKIYNHLKLGSKTKILKYIFRISQKLSLFTILSQHLGYRFVVKFANTYFYGNNFENQVIYSNKTRVQWIPLNLIPNLSGKKLCN